MKNYLLLALALVLLASGVQADIIGPEPFTLLGSMILVVLVINLAINGGVVLLVQKYFLKNPLQNVSGKKIVISLIAITLLGWAADYIGPYLFMQVLQPPFAYVPLLSFFTIFLSILIFDTLLFKLYTKLSTKNSIVLAAFLGVFTNPILLFLFASPFQSMGIFILIPFIILPLAGIVAFWILTGSLASTKPADGKILLKLRKYLAILLVVGVALFIVSNLFSYKPVRLRDPTDKTIELLNDLYNKPESIKITQMPITFTPNYVLSASALSESTSLSAENICMSLGEFEEDSDRGFLLSDGSPHHRITWNGYSNQNIRIAVTCNITREKLMEDIEGTMFEEWNPNCGICEGQGRCCIVALVNP